MKWLLAGLFFISIFIIYIFVFSTLLGRKEKKLEKRMNRYIKNIEEPTKDENVHKVKSPPLKINLDATKKHVRQKLLTKDKNNRIELLLQRAGVPLKPEEYVMFQWIATILGAGLLFLITENVLLCLIGALFGHMIPKVIIKNKQQKRMRAFNDALPEMIAAVIGSLRAGFSFSQALKSVMEESRSPMKDELNIVLKELQYGTTMEDALNHLYDRMPSDDLDIMIQAVTIQRQVGGNLATVLEKIVETIRDRIKIQGQIKTLTAQGRLSGMVIGLLPVILAAALYAIEPGYIGPLFSHPVGIGLLIFGAISCLIGFLLIRKLTTIEV